MTRKNNPWQVFIQIIDGLYGENRTADDCNSHVSDRVNSIVPDSLDQYIDMLCNHIAAVQDGYEASDAFNPTTEAQLRVGLAVNGELVGMRRALAITLGLDPNQESDKDEGADAYYAEWRQRQKR